MNNKISVITVTYNCKEDLKKTLKSIVGQDYDNKEIIIIDGGSIDGTVDVIKENHDKIYYWISEKDSGIYDAMNKGINVASGDWINFMNAGDSFYDNHVLSNVAKHIDVKATIVYGQLMKVYKRFKFISNPNPVNLDEMNGSVRLPHQALFAKANYIKNHLFDTSYRSAADFKFYYEAYFVDHCKFQYLPFLIANYDSETGMSKDSHIGTVESLKIQGKELNEKQINCLILKYKIINFLKKYLPERVITRIREHKFSKGGYTIINN